MSLYLKGTFSANGSSFQGKKATLKYHWDLNPFIPGQKTILNTPNNSLQISVEIRKIKFSDGSELHMLDELPRSQKYVYIQTKVRKLKINV